MCQVGGDLTQVPSVASLLSDKSPYVQGAAGPWIQALLLRCGMLDAHQLRWLHVSL